MLEPVHFSYLKNMSLSPAHYLASLDDPNADKLHLKLGRLVHHFLLGAKYTFAVFPGERRQGKVWEEFKERHKDKDIFKAQEIDEAQAIARAVKMNTLAQPFLEGDRERLIQWEYLKRACSSRIDVLNDFIVEFKHTQCAKPEKFRWDALRFHYHAQCAFYQDAARSIGRKTKGAIIIAVEKQPPYVSTVFELSQESLEEGRKLNRLWMERVLACERANEWPGYSQSVVPLDLTRREEESITLLIGGEEVAA